MKSENYATAGLLRAGAAVNVKQAGLPQALSNTKPTSQYQKPATDGLCTGKTKEPKDCRHCGSTGNEIIPTCCRHCRPS